MVDAWLFCSIDWLVRSFVSSSSVSFGDVLAVFEVPPSTSRSVFSFYFD